MYRLPQCKFHPEPISFVNLLAGIIKEQRALCSRCYLERPKLIQLAFQEKQQLVEYASEQFNKYFTEFTQPIKQQIRCLDDFKIQFNATIDQLKQKLQYHAEQLQIIIKIFYINQILTLNLYLFLISKIQQKIYVIYQGEKQWKEQVYQQIKKKINKEQEMIIQRKKRYQAFIDDKINKFNQKVTEITQLQEIGIINEIKELQDKLTPILQIYTLQRNLAEGLLKYESIEKINIQEEE